MLYPTSVNPDPNSFNVYEIASGNLFCFEFVLGDNEAKEILITHPFGINQDNSLRCWISRDPGSNPVVEVPYYIIWHANRNQFEIRTVVSEGADFPNAKMPIELPAGNYVVNVLNLVNSANAFTYTLTDI